MRFVHTADTHIGASHHGRTEREDDFREAFSEMIERTLELAPDAFVHAGDLFDKHRPSVKDIHFAANELMRLIRNNIEVILLPGNHDRRSVRGELAPQSILELLGAKVFSLAEGKSLYRVNDVELWGIPYIGDADTLRGLISDMAEKARSPAVLVLHQYIYPPARLLPLLYPDDIPPVFSYAALGHWHIPYIGERYAYPGSTETKQLSSEEASVEKRCFYLVEMDDNSLRIEPHYLLSPRPFFYLECTEEDIAAKMIGLREKMGKSPKKPMLKIKLSGGPRMRADEVVDSALLSAGLKRKDFLLISTDTTRQEVARSRASQAKEARSDAAERFFGNDPELLGVVLAMREAIIKAESERESSGTRARSDREAILRSAKEAAEQYLKEKADASVKTASEKLSEPQGNRG